MRILVGDPAYYNSLATGTVTCSPAASASFPLSYLWDQNPGTPFQWGSYAADSWIKVNTSRFTNTALTADLTGLTDADTGTGASTHITGANARGGSGGALQLVGSDASNVGSRYFDVVVRAGSKWMLDCWTAGDAGTGLTQVRIFNPATGNWLAAGGGSWSAAAANAASGGTSGAYANTTVTFEVESYQACLADTVTLRVEFRCLTGTSRVDDILFLPGIDLCTVHGHTLDPRWAVTLRSSDDDSSYTTRGTFTLAHPACFIYVGSVVYAKWWQFRVQFTGTAPAGVFSPTVPMLGELVLGLSTVPTATILNPHLESIKRSERMPQHRISTAGGFTYVRNLLLQPVRTLRLPFKTFTSAADRSLLEDCWRRSGCGAYAIVVVPDDGEPDVIFGRMPDESSSTRAGGIVGSPLYKAALVIEEMPGPTVGS